MKHKQRVCIKKLWENITLWDFTLLNVCLVSEQSSMFSHRFKLTRRIVKKLLCFRIYNKKEESKRIKSNKSFLVNELSAWCKKQKKMNENNFEEKLRLIFVLRQWKKVFCSSSFSIHIKDKKKSHWKSNPSLLRNK